MRKCIGSVVFAVCLTAAAQPAAIGPKIIPSEPMGELERALRDARRPPSPTASSPERRLDIRPSGDPIYVVEEKQWDGDQWRTYRRPKVERFSRDSAGVAVQGYDVVSYFDNQVEKGSGELAVDHGGVKWLFTTAEHRRRFLATPERFLPEYGAFCAYSVGRGFPAAADPKVYAVYEGKLYFFFDPAVKAVWEQQQREAVEKADRNWPRVHLN